MLRQKRQASQYREGIHTSCSVKFPGHVGRQEDTKCYRPSQGRSWKRSTSAGRGGTGLREAKGQNGPLPSRRIITSHVS